ncbi:glycerate kinase [Microbacterium resistens]|uniref:Glycerate kinase n=1 Tax=Microbacterium resistens TaxID=156977 RepID=A0ABU1SFM1_9MICO|nr:glycerate kinase [Microbacterium resistens]MDR6868381.1 glycerate kinase [Microbacterium resistens]
MTRVVLAPDGFKGSISAADAADALAEGWADVDPGAELLLRPMADGGEGTVAAFAAAVPGARTMRVTVEGPAGAPVETTWLLLPPTADAPEGTGVIDLASTSGIELLDAPRPWDADTTGFGQAIAAALAHGVSRLILGIGSSASTDGGTGFLGALGARLLDGGGAPIPRGARGLASVTLVDRSELVAPPPTLVLTDVTNPLTGPQGAAAVFGPQKGLIAADAIAEVDRGLDRLAALLDLDPRTPGAGAAGGTGGALLAWGATLAPGAQEVARLVGLAEAVAGADVVITGEGSFDGQSGAGKAPAYVAALAAEAGVRVALAAGRIAGDADVSSFAASTSLVEIAGSTAAALGHPARHLRTAGSTLARMLLG